MTTGSAAFRARFFCRLRRGDLLADESRAADTLDPPAGKRVQRRRT